MWGILLLVLCSVAQGQDENDVNADTGFPLTAEQIALCGPTGYFADPDDCCWFVQCDSYSEDDDDTYTIGHRVACMGGSVWNSEKCACEEPNADNPCDPATCDVPEFITPPCPTAGLNDDQCCIEGIVVTILNDTSYYLEEEGILQNQTCPFELLFNPEDCCCDSTTFTAPPPMCDHYTFDNLPFADEGVIASGAELLSPGADPGLGATAGAISFAAGAAAGASYGTVNRFSNVDFSNGFATSFWMMAEGSGSSAVFHNGDAGAQGSTVSVELIQTSGGGFAIAGGVSTAVDGATDFYQETNWSPGSWHYVSMSYSPGGELTYSLDSGVPVTVNEADEVADEAVLEIFKSAASEASQAVESASETVRRRIQNVGADDPGISELQGVLDCVEQIKRDLEDNKEYLDDVQRGLDDFRKVRRRFRRAFNQFNKPKKRNDETRDQLQDILERARDAFELLRQKVSAICDSLDKVCDILGNKDLLRQLDSGSKKTLKRLKRKLKRLKGKFEDDSGEGKFSLRSIDKTFEEADRNIAEYDRATSSGRKKRQADAEDDEEEEVDTSITPSKFPITIGEDFNGSIDELFICDFPITEEQVEALRIGNENPIMPMTR